jgi:hypothetical protein
MSFKSQFSAACLLGGFMGVVSLSGCLWRSTERRVSVEKPVMPGPNSGGSREVLSARPIQGTPQICQVIVAGGSTAALAAALTSARQGIQTCLVEPTDWPGGQLTASAVSAIDFAWHQTDTVNVKVLGKKAANIPSEFNSWVLGMGNPGGCWVSRSCFEPKNLLQRFIEPALAKESTLTVYRNSVVKRVEMMNGGTDGKRIRSVLIVRRTPKEQTANGGYDTFLSQDMPDWYAPGESVRFKKEIFELRAPDGATPIVIDGTEFGEIMVLAGASYLQGLEKSEGSLETAQETCGQSFVYPFVAKMNEKPVTETVPGGPPDHPEFYSVDSHGWTKVWTYRRIRGSGSSANDNELSLQNWNPGNDYPYGYLLRTRVEATAERSDWKGGVNYASLEAAERHALGFYRWYRQHAGGNGDLEEYLSLERSVLGTSHGLSKLPYVRDTRRSIGLDNFIITGRELQGGGTTGTRFADRIGIGAYTMDIHGMHANLGCRYPEYNHLTLPFYLPFRAHTNRDVENLLVTGKTMAQSFLANSATRLQPIEFSSGVGAGAAAAVMTQNRIYATREILTEKMEEVQTMVRRYAPIDWTF